MREPFGRTRVYLTMLMLAEVFLGAAIIIVTFIYQRILGAYMADVERKMLGGQFFNTYLLGFQLLVVYSCSIAMWASLWSRRCSSNVNLLLNLWMFFCFVIVLCGFGTVWSLFACADALENTAEMSLLKGIDLYYTCPEWKLLWDGLQYHKECCGVHSYKDWMKANWMPPEAAQCQSSGSTDTALAPYACCKHTCTTCYENYIPRSDASRIPYLTVSQINTEGCLPLFTDKMWEILYVLLALVLIAFKLDIVICCLAKYIIRNQAIECCGIDNDDFVDDDGRPMVIVKCPQAARGVSFDVDDGERAQQMAPKIGRPVDPCYCNANNLLRGYNVKQEVVHMSTPTPPQRKIQRCDCCAPKIQICGGAGGGGGGGCSAAAPRILH